MGCTQAFAHADFWTTQDFGNVKVRIVTGYKYEEIQKVLIIGRLAESLAKRLGYNEQIFLDFKHHYIDDCISDYFIAFDDGMIEYTWSKEEDDRILHDDAVVVRQVARRFDAATTLRLLEYAIKNVPTIRKTQQLVLYNKNYCQWKINTIDTTTITAQVNLPNSDLVNEILKIQVDRPETDFDYGITYYWKDNHYQILMKLPGGGASTLLQVDQIYFFKRVGAAAVVFDTDSTFYYLSWYDRRPVPTRHVIDDIRGYYRPCDVQSISSTMISITMAGFSRDPSFRGRTLIYQIDTDTLTQDLDALLDRK